MKTNTQAAPADEKIVHLPLDQLRESPFNPRKTFNDEGLDELATDIRAVGEILQPLRVRPIVPELFSDQFAEGDESVITGWEVVFGHRRRRAAIMAELKTVPCVVRVMTDQQVKRAQISENLQREDVHPIEEAEGFEALMKDHQLTADDIAEQTGKSRSYVYGRLKLLAAVPSVRNAYLQGKIGSEVALLIARVRTEKLQTKALARIESQGRTHELTNGGKDSFRTIRTILNEYFALDLKSAIFELEDETLAPAAGRCSSCPKRSGNAPEFEDVAKPSQEKSKWGGRIGVVRHEGANVCTDPDCFADKKAAHLKRAADTLKSPSCVVVTGNAARAAVSAMGEVKGNYIAASKVKGVVKAGTGAASIAIAKGQTVPIAVKIQDPRDGKVYEAFKLADLKAAGVKIAEPKPTTRSGYSNRDWQEEQRKRDAASKVETDLRKARWHRLRAAVAQRPRDAQDLALLVDYSLFQLADDEAGEMIAEAWGAKSVDALIEASREMSRDDQARVLMDVVTSLHVQLSGWEHENGVKAHYLDQACVSYGIDCAEGASTPSAAGASEDKGKAGAGTSKRKGNPLVVDADDARGGDRVAAVASSSDEAEASGLQSSLTAPAAAGEEQSDGGRVAAGSGDERIAWPFPRPSTSSEAAAV